MNPQQPGGPLPPPNPNPQPQPAPPQPITPVINIPGQDPYVAAPVQPANPVQQPSVEHSPYDFIMNPQQAAKKPSLLSGGSKIQRIAIVAGVLTLLLIIGIIFASVIGGGGGNQAPMVTVAQEQTELIRIASQGTQYAVSQKTQNLANNVSVSLTSADNQLLTYLKSNHQKISTKTLALKRNTQTDTTLKNARTDSTFDSAFTDIVQKSLTSYLQSLKAAFDANPGPKGRTLLNTQYNDAQLLLQQSKQ